MEKKSSRGRKKQYQKENLYSSIFKRLNPCYIINSNFSAKTTAFGLHYIFLFPLWKQWGGAKRHSPRIISSLNHSVREQSSHRRGHLNHTAHGPFYVSLSPLSEATNAVHPVCTLVGNIVRSHRALRTNGKHLRGRPVLCNSYIHTHTGTEPEELCKGPQPKPNLEDRVNTQPRAVLMWPFSGQQQSQSHSSWHNAWAVLQEKRRASFLFFSKKNQYAWFQLLKRTQHQVMLMEFTHRTRYTLYSS